MTKTLLDELLKLNKKSTHNNIINFSIHISNKTLYYRIYFFILLFSFTTNKFYWKFDVFYIMWYNTNRILRRRSWKTWSSTTGTRGYWRRGKRLRWRFSREESRISYLAWETTWEFGNRRRFPRKKGFDRVGMIGEEILISSKLSEVEKKEILYFLLLSEAEDLDRNSQ